jgi:hypothetical protein
VTPYFLSESAIEEQGRRKIRSRGKVFLKFHTHPHQLSVNNKKFCSIFCCCYFIFIVLPLSETYRHGWRKAKIATQSIHIMLCYFNGFVYRLSFCSQGQLFDISMDNVDMVYMNIMICWNIIMVMCIYFGPATDVCRWPIISKPWPYNLYNLPNKTINTSLLFIICLFLYCPE